jgi:tRNA (adenine57-N1/adenine58-N1)-methyltransferase catalytic subunit
MNYKKILICKKDNKKYFVTDLTKEFLTPYGKISPEQLNSDQFVTEKGVNFVSLEPQFIDLFEKIKRGPQGVNDKDTGIIIAKTGLNNTFKIVDAGGGNGILSLKLANLCAQITVYENNPRHYQILKENVGMFGFENITIKEKNIYEGIDEDNLDLITLDLPEPWQVIDSAFNKMKRGSFLVVYLPNILQMQNFILKAKGKFKVIETIELLERKWKVDENIVRPEFEMLGHTGFISFLRKW